MFDLDDTLLWDKKSVQDAFNLTCTYAEKEKGVDKKKLEEHVRSHARELYASYDTYEFTKMIGINPFEGLWATFEDEGAEFERLHQIAPTYQKEAWHRGLQEVGVDNEYFAGKLANAFRENRKQTAYVFSDAIDILEKLKPNYYLLLLTNGSPNLQNVKLDLSRELVPYFDHILISGDFGVGKPDTSIFHHALNLLDVHTANAMMVGDNLHTDIIGANSAGVSSVWLNRFGQKNDTGIRPKYQIKSLKELVLLIK